MTGPKPGVSTAMPSPGAPGRSVFLAPFSLCIPRGCTRDCAPNSVSVTTVLAPLLCEHRPSAALIRTLGTAVRAHLDNPGEHPHLKILNLWDHTNSGDQDVGMFWGAIFQYTTAPTLAGMMQTLRRHLCDLLILVSGAWLCTQRPSVSMCVELC